LLAARGCGGVTVSELLASTAGCHRRWHTIWCRRVRLLLFAFAKQALPALFVKVWVCWVPHPTVPYPRDRAKLDSI